MVGSPFERKNGTEKLLASRPKKKTTTKKRTTVEMRREMPYGKSARSVPVRAKTRQKAKMPAAITEAAWPRKNRRNAAMVPCEPNTTTGKMMMEAALTTKV